ncbi:MAG TPA: MarP family serine protease [Candidatus Limnocylindrales bacterium]
MNLLDLLAVTLLAVAFILGLRSGALPQLLGLAGAAAGVLVAIEALPLAQGPLSNLDPGFRALAVLVVLFFGLAVGEGLGSGVGTYLRFKLGPGVLGRIDQVGGGLVGFAQGVLIVWLVGGLIAVSALPTLTRQAQRSVTLRTLDAVLPPPTSLTGDLRRLLDASGLPDLFVGLEPLPEPPVALPGSGNAKAIAAAAIASTVEVQDDACGYTLTGTGFAISRGYVVTNAHVIAGGHDILLDLGGATYDATAVLFDPELDIAVLYAPALPAPALRFATESPARGTEAAALGHPLAGPLTIIPAGITGSYEAEGRDLYGTRTVTRQIVELRGRIQRGDSGGPLVLADGSVGGVVFAEARNSPDVGYALSPVEVAARVMPAIGRTGGVGTGPCTQ